MTIQGERITREELWQTLANGVDAINGSFGADWEFMQALAPGTHAWLVEVQQLTQREQHAVRTRLGTPAKLAALEACENLRLSLARVNVPSMTGDTVDASQIF